MFTLIAGWHWSPQVIQKVSSSMFMNRKDVSAENIQGINSASGGARCPSPMNKCFQAPEQPERHVPIGLFVAHFPVQCLPLSLFLSLTFICYSPFFVSLSFFLAFIFVFVLDWHFYRTLPCPVFGFVFFLVSIFYLTFSFFLCLSLFPFYLYLALLL